MVLEHDPAPVQATFEYGIVRITLPKAEWAKPQKIAIQAGSGQHAIGARASSEGRDAPEWRGE